MTDRQRHTEEERRQSPFAGDVMAARMQAMMRRCAGWTGYGKGVVAEATTGAEGEEAEPTEPPCSCH